MKNWEPGGRQPNVLYDRQILHDDGDLAGRLPQHGPLGSLPVGQSAVSRQQIISCRNVPPASSVVPHRSSNVAVVASTKEKRGHADNTSRGRIQRGLSSCFGNKSGALVRHPSPRRVLIPLFLCRRQAIARPSTPSTDLIYVTAQIRCTTAAEPLYNNRSTLRPDSQAFPSWQFPVFFVPAQA